ncbi:MAG: AIR synthase-related protein [Intestinimonas sp.]
MLAGFRDLDDDGLEHMLQAYGLAMDVNDLKFFQRYMRAEEQREPTLTELRLVDTYWSDHCRHTTFSTHIDKVEILEPAVEEAYRQYLAARVEVYGEEKAARRPQTLMDLATIATKVLKSGACSSGWTSPRRSTPAPSTSPPRWMGRRRTGSSCSRTRPTTTPPRSNPSAARPPASAAPSGTPCPAGPMCTKPCASPAAATPAPRWTRPWRASCPSASCAPDRSGRILPPTATRSAWLPDMVSRGLPPGLYRQAPGDRRRGGRSPRAPTSSGRRPRPGDKVILLGGRTGRDGIGGATGSSKSHDLEVPGHHGLRGPEGQRPEERKIQRLFRDPAVTRLIKRCNDFGAGGVSVAIGELADGL